MTASMLRARFWARSRLWHRPGVKTTCILVPSMPWCPFDLPTEVLHRRHAWSKAGQGRACIEASKPLTCSHRSHRSHPEFESDHCSQRFDHL